MKYCKICGCPLKKTSHGRWWCAVCFQIVEGSEEKTDSDEKPSYIG